MSQLGISFYARVEGRQLDTTHAVSNFSVHTFRSRGMKLACYVRRLFCKAGDLPVEADP